MEEIQSNLKYVEHYFKFKDDLHGLSLCFKKVWIWKDTTLVIDFEFEGLRIGINIEQKINEYQNIDLILRENRRKLEINWANFCKYNEQNKHFHLFLHSIDDGFTFCLTRIVQIIKNIFNEAKYLSFSRVINKIDSKEGYYSGLITNFNDFDKNFTFFVNNPYDTIQKHYINGILYENEELKIIEKYSKPNSIFFDIGSNIGNHTIFMAKVLKAKQIVVFEANPKTIDFLKINIKLNDVVDIVNTDYLGIGLGDTDGEFTLNEPSQNLGGTRLIQNNNKEIKSNTTKSIVKVHSLDSLNLTVAPDFIKIDVEGMELAVLKGMQKIIHKYKPNIFIEVNDSNLEDFNRWIRENNYVILDMFRRYETNQNFLISWK